MTFSDKDFSDFVKGFFSQVPPSYNFLKDATSGRPWCAPWVWTTEDAWQTEGLPAYEQGQAWGRDCYEELEKLMADAAA